LENDKDEKYDVIYPLIFVEPERSDLDDFGLRWAIDFREEGDCFDATGDRILLPVDEPPFLPLKERLLYDTLLEQSSSTRERRSLSITTISLARAEMAFFPRRLQRFFLPVDLWTQAEFLRDG